MQPIVFDSGLIIIAPMRAFGLDFGFGSGVDEGGEGGDEGVSGTRRRRQMAAVTSRMR